MTRKLGLLPIVAVLLLGPVGCGQEETPPATTSSASAPTDETPVELVTAELGQTAPLFSLPSSTGTEVDLADVVGEQPVVLVFYRGNW
jgi:hypothetical protein